MYSKVLIAAPARQLDRPFYYAVPETLRQLVRPGVRVQVPLRNRLVAGYVLEVSGELPADEELNPEEIKAVRAVIDEEPVFTPEQLALARWLAERYLCPLVVALETIIGPRLAGNKSRQEEKIWPALPPGITPDFGRSTKKELVWQVVNRQPGINRKELCRVTGVSETTIRAMIKAGWLKSERTWRREGAAAAWEGEAPGFTLTAEQKAALAAIEPAINAGEQRVFVLHGVTGSGKTEIYLRLVESVLKAGRQALCLVPEIALTPQMIDIFQRRFGPLIAVLHSRLADGERYQEYMRIACREARVVLGTRSAVFAPVADTGLIIIDEEHEPSYKQEETPRYHAREVALYLAGRDKAVVVLGSATPSVETYYRALPGGPYRLLELKHRVENRPLPSVHIVDMREEIKSGNRGIFSRPLLDAIKKALTRKEQVILFLNRRGFFTFVICRECGLVLKCPYCDLALTYHANGRLRCHYCYYTVLAPSFCPACQSKDLGYFGTGTQKVERETAELFPEARLLRMDTDAVVRKGSYERIIKAFLAGEADILVGTQMIAKGLDNPRVTVVGVVNADISLNMPDFRAAERTFQLLSQVAGRAGRGESGGQVFIQTYMPHHYAVQAAGRHDYRSFFYQEIKLRRTMFNPPFSALVRLLVSGSSESDVQKAVTALALAARSLLEEIPEEERPQLLGPAPAPVSKMHNRYRHHLVLKGRSLRALYRVTTGLVDEYEARLAVRQLRISIDVDPLSLM